MAKHIIDDKEIQRLQKEGFTIRNEMFGSYGKGSNKSVQMIVEFDFNCKVETAKVSYIVKDHGSEFPFAQLFDAIADYNKRV